jgi:pimeloyl-ACP methyl ester carboxylesterase
MISATSDPSSGRSRLRFRRVYKWLIMSMALIVAAGAVFQLSVTQWESYRYPPSGKLVDIDGLRLHINCTGAGSPTVIMDAALGDTSVIWQLVQPEISRFTRVCSYDRAGLGWSEAPNEPRTSSNIASELDGLLTRASVPGPYVLVGSSFGGYNIRVFASRHRKQVVGMVLVDSAHPDQLNRPPFGIGGRLKPEYERMVSRYYKVAIWTMSLGVPRILGWCQSAYTFPNQPTAWATAWARFAPEAIALNCRLRSLRTQQAEFREFGANGHIAATTGPFGNMPLVVLSHDPQVGGGPFFSPADALEAERVATEMQEELRGLSSRSKRIVAKGSRHCVQCYRPDLVVAAVHEIVNDARGTAPFQAAPETEYK